MVLAGLGGVAEESQPRLGGEGGVGLAAFSRAVPQVGGDFVV